MALLNIDQFVQKYNNNKINNGGTECVALANQFEAEVVGGGWIPANWANDWWSTQDADIQNYVRVAPNAEVPQKGDLIVWDKYPKAAGGTIPHIALSLGGFNCFTQSGSTNAHIEKLINSGVLGYLRPKRFIVSSNATDDQIRQAYRDILERDADQGGLEHYRHYTLDFVVKDLQASNEKRDLENRKSQAHPLAVPTLTTYLQARGDYRSLYSADGPFTANHKVGTIYPNQNGGVIEMKLIGDASVADVKIVEYNGQRYGIYVGGEAKPLTSIIAK